MSDWRKPIERRNTATHLLNILSFLHQQIVVLETHRSVSGSLDEHVGQWPQRLEESRSGSLELRSKAGGTQVVSSILPRRVGGLACSALGTDVIARGPQTMLTMMISQSRPIRHVDPTTSTLYDLSVCPDLTEDEFLTATCLGNRHLSTYHRTRVTESAIFLLIVQPKLTEPAIKLVLIAISNVITQELLFP